MKIITWNVNSIRTRLERVLGVLERHQPDLLCLQETKVVDEDFPHEALREVGYRADVHGQKTYNGVALLSRDPLDDVVPGFDGNPAPEQARVISCTYQGVRFINAYVVNGKDIGTPHYELKLKWLDGLATWIDRLYSADQPLVLLGDFNIIPEDRDCWDAEYWQDRILNSKPEKRALQTLMEWGLSDLYRKHNQEDGKYSWWDYRAGRFPRGHGLRIDLALGTASALQMCNSSEIDRDERKKGKWEAKPSDHAPVIVTLEP
jgi:exodeoxyribonuclease III